MRVAVMGVGGVGGYFGGLLARSGEEVHFIARGEHLAAIQRNGLRVESVHGDFVIAPASAHLDPAEVGPVDLVLLATKTYQLEAAVRQLGPLLGAGAAILPLQNGVDAADRAAAILAGDAATAAYAGAVLGGACWVASAVAGPGIIRQQSQFRRVVVGEPAGGITPRVERIVAALARTGAVAEASPNIRKVLWTKFLFIAAFGGLAAVARVPAGPLLAHPETRELLEAAMREVEALALAEGVTLDPDVVPQTMDFCARLEPDTTASMQRDILAGRPSELEAHNGLIARRGAELGVAVPVNRFIYAALLPQERHFSDLFATASRQVL